MPNYHPEDPPMAGMKPGDPTSRLVKWTFKELGRVSQAMGENVPLHLDVTYHRPPKPQDGDIYYADGTSWNPGSGRGLYYWKVNTWKLIA
jgi:hypothetical protein